jgi:hypothetical protein
MIGNLTFVGWDCVAWVGFAEKSFLAQGCRLRRKSFLAQRCRRKTTMTFVQSILDHVPILSYH